MHNVSFISINRLRFTFYIFKVPPFFRLYISLRFFDFYRYRRSTANTTHTCWFFSLEKASGIYNVSFFDFERFREALHPHMNTRPCILYIERKKNKQKLLFPSRIIQWKASFIFLCAMWTFSLYESKDPFLEHICGEYTYSYINPRGFVLCKAKE